MFRLASGNRLRTNIVATFNKVDLSSDSFVVLAHSPDFFWQISRPDSGQLPSTRRGGVQTAPHRTRTRALSRCAPHMWSYVRLKGLTIRLCVSKKSFHLWSYLFWKFLRSHFLLSSLRLPRHRRHWLESDQTRARLRSWVDRLAHLGDPTPNTGLVARTGLMTMRTLQACSGRSDGKNSEKRAPRKQKKKTISKMICCSRWRYCARLCKAWGSRCKMKERRRQ